MYMCVATSLNALTICERFNMHAIIPTYTLHFSFIRRVASKYPNMDLLIFTPRVVLYISGHILYFMLKGQLILKKMKF